ncbi:MAG: signal peptidase I [Solirubrobacteraceae bacterium]
MPETVVKRKTRLHSIVELLVTVAVAVGLALGIQAFLLKPYRIPSLSMWPTLAKGQRILVNRLDTHPGLYDVVVFHPPAGANPQPAVCENHAQGGGDPQPCDSSTPSESTQTFVKRVVGLPGDRLLITDGHVWRNGVEEKGSYIQPCPGGPNCTFAKAISVPPGEYYMMGDNRGISDDSRFWGPVPQRWIIGVAFFTYWPVSRIGSL